ncbi:MAG: phosphoribosylformylglycinamidine synthase [Crocinitomicaceae bacterium]|nr:phosphoribosylformylglycinamidine synthase [Crocinitomicaceae bacterium]
MVTNLAVAQFYDDSLTKAERDSIYISETESNYEKPKVLHAEPLYIDLIRDLGARKGEREWNIGMGMIDHDRYDAYEALIEYEWAPIDRLGLEIEIPVQFYIPLEDVPIDSIPASRIESLKLAAQWSFFVSEKLKTTFALGYIHEFELTNFRSFGSPFLYGNLFNPFFIGAKRWGNNFHTLIYTGPRIFYSARQERLETEYEMHTNFHYMISGTRNFIGIEINKYFNPDFFDITLRPQMRVAFADNLLIGIVPSIPIERKSERLGMFLRVIWEPKHH